MIDFDRSPHLVSSGVNWNTLSTEGGLADGKHKAAVVNVAVRKQLVKHN